MNCDVSGFMIDNATIVSDLKVSGKSFVGLALRDVIFLELLISTDHVFSKPAIERFIGVDMWVALFDSAPKCLIFRDLLCDFKTSDFHDNLRIGFRSLDLAETNKLSDIARYRLASEIIQ